LDTVGYAFKPPKIPRPMRDVHVLTVRDKHSSDFSSNKPSATSDQSTHKNTMAR
jgi:hypothetical protein